MANIAVSHTAARGSIPRIGITFCTCLKVVMRLARIQFFSETFLYDISCYLLVLIGYLIILEQVSLSEQSSEEELPSMNA